jgi:hypothetical protein
VCREATGSQYQFQARRPPPDGVRLANASMGQSCNNLSSVIRTAISVIPAQAGNQFCLVIWFPACAGMTWFEVLSGLIHWGQREV